MSAVRGPQHQPFHDLRRQRGSLAIAVARSLGRRLVHASGSPPGRTSASPAGGAGPGPAVTVALARARASPPAARARAARAAPGAPAVP